MGTMYKERETETKSDLGLVSKVRDFIARHAKVLNNKLKHVARPPVPLVGQKFVVILLEFFHFSAPLLRS